MSDDKLPTSRPISDINSIYREYAKKKFTDQADIIKDYIKLMIPLTTGVITAYIGLLEFMKVEVTDSNLTSFLSPPITLLISLIIFIIAHFPIPFPLSYSNIESIKLQLKVSTIFKYIGSSLGSIAFVIGFYQIITILIGYL